MERGEVDGICESLDSVKNRRPDWIPKQTVHVCCRAAPSRTGAQGVPFVLDLARNDEEKQAIAFLYAGQGIGRPFVAPIFLPTASRCCATRSTRP